MPAGGKEIGKENLLKREREHVETDSRTENRARERESAALWKNGGENARFDQRLYLWHGKAP